MSKSLLFTVKKKTRKSIEKKIDFRLLIKILRALDSDSPNLSLYEILYLNQKKNDTIFPIVETFLFFHARKRSPPLRSLIFLPHYFFVAAEVGVTAHLAICLFARKSLGLCVHALALCVIARGGGEEGRNERGNFCDRVEGV